MTNKEIYKALCEQNEMPLFFQYWWLESVCAGKDWDVVIVRSADCGGDGEDIVAAMPYETDKWLWNRYIKPSEMTPYAGVWFSESIRTDESKRAAVFEYIRQWLSNSKIRAYHQRLYPRTSLPASLQETGFRIAKRGTYIIEDTSNLDDVLDGFSRNKRKKLERLTQTYSVTDVDPEDFYRFHAASCRQKNRRIWYSRELLLVIVEKAQQHGQCRLLGVRNAEGELLAEGLLVWDKWSVYMLVNAFDHDVPAGGAREKLVFEVISEARKLGLRLDFTGAGDYLKNYGAKRQRVTSLHYGSLPFVAMQKFIDWLRG